MQVFVSFVVVVFEIFLGLAITHHANVTQCLGAVSGACWYLGVARASVVVSDEAAVKGLEEIGTTDNAGLPSSEVDEKVQKKLTKSHAGHCYVPPSPDDVTVFRIDGPQFVKLHRGTWHVGPLFTVPMMDFYNLELSNTQVRFFLSYDSTVRRVLAL